MRYHDWATALTVSGQSAPILNGTVTPTDDLTAEALRFRYVISKYVPSRDIAVGIGVQNVMFQVTEAAGEALFSINGTGIMAGATYVPRLQSFRVAGAIETRILGAEVTSTCDPDDCRGYILPEKVTSPARLIAGFAYRFAETPWNQLVGGTFRDERSLTLTSDVLISGSSPNAYGIEAFGMQMLQRSGNHPSVSVRAGAEVEALPGRLRLRAGSYWEPQRFEGVDGRIHVTFGVELRVFELNLWGRRRGRISGTADLASRYTNIAASLGFWH